MKVQNEHLELIKAAETYLNDASLKNHIKLNVAIDNSKCFINSIASVEPEPLAKNKDSESKCSCAKPFIRIDTKPNSCGNCGKVV